MFDVHEHLKEDACNITAFLPPGDQTMKYKFSPGAKYGKQHSESGVNTGSVGDGKQDILFMVPNQ